MPLAGVEPAIFHGRSPSAISAYQLNKTIELRMHPQDYLNFNLFKSRVKRAIENMSPI